LGNKVYAENRRKQKIIHLLAMGFPDGVILLGARAWVSFIGIVMIVIGQWQADRIWDDTVFAEGPMDDENTTTSSNPNPNTTTNDIAATAGEIVDSAYEYIDTVYRAISDPNGVDYQRAHKLYTGPSGFSLIVALLGWFLLCISFLLECHMIPNTWNITFLTVTHFLVGLILAMIQAVLLPLAIRNRTVHVHIHFFTLALFCCYIVLGILVVLDRNESPIWFPIVATAAIAIAPNLLWYCRKRGDTYDRAAILTPRPVMYNVGGPLLVTGWLMLWVAMNFIKEENPDRRYIPIYLSSRTAVAFEGAITIFAAYWATGYAHDEHDDPEQIAALETLSRHENLNRTPRPLKAFVFGRILETRILFLIGWTMISVSVFLPIFYEGGRFWKILLLLLLIAQGFAIGVQHVIGIRAGDETKLQKWTRVADSIFVLIIFFVFITAGFFAGLFVLFGVLLLIGGWNLLQTDRKRGTYWMEHRTTNPNWTVYSYGVLVFPLGLLLFAWGLSIP
jgi:hypothetical protein